MSFHAPSLTIRITRPLAALLLAAACTPTTVPGAVTPAASPAATVASPAAAPVSPVAAVPAGSVSSPAVSAENGAKGVAQWSYSGSTGAEAWGTLDASYATCATGKAQTPIDITGTVGKDLPDLAFAYQPGISQLVNNGHTVQANVPAGSVLRTGTATYTLLQYHFHAPSEHTINGQSFPLEMHFVHRDEAGRLGVVGVIYKVGATNPAYDTLVGNLPPATDGKADLPSLNPMTLLPTQFGNYQYQGSLTTPPCSEGVQWMLLRTPVELSQGQIGAFTARYANNARPIQPQGTRIVQQK
ncbi:MAG: carbonic anhydrase family protein [Candidatus Sericytochromatia bacterium]|nr:carbonic anhydrase family protein [Candidatus Sericytochromatia bacterium]